jgi:periplasmic divalent cation tolerance protein
VTDKIVILVTAGNRREAKKIARALVEERLAACVNITLSVESVYRWKGKVTEDREYLLLIKSSRELFGEVQAAVRKRHSYTTPEIICLPIVDGSRDYLDWITDSVRHPAEDMTA